MPAQTGAALPALNHSGGIPGDLTASILVLQQVMQAVERFLADPAPTSA